MVDGRTITLIASEAECNTLQRAFANLSKTEFNGARAHLEKAAEHLTIQKFADSIRESINAVESVARTLEPSGKLSSALAKLECSSNVHPCLKRGFNAIYDYTSDEKGLRHPLLDGTEAKVDETDAIFMIGACAAFVSYMIQKSRAV